MTEKEKIRCFHCGDDCGSYPVMYDEKPFCCYGCRTVYEILREKDACEYYRIQDFPGLKAREDELGRKYAYLDNEEIRGELIDFSDGGISRIRFYVPSIHCSSCIWLLENLNRFAPGIIHSSVNFTKKEVSLTFRESEISLRQLVELLATINYPPHISLDDLDKNKGKKEQTKIYIQLGIAGFCFGNIMLFSFPEYLAGEGQLEEFFRFKFAYLNLLLSLPVVFYAGRDYFISAYRGLRKKIINIDVPIALGITVLFTRSAYEILAGIGPGYLDSLSGLVFFLLIGKWYQGKTYRALSFERDYRSYFPVAVTILDEPGQETTVPLKKLRPGHRILVRNKELVPADSILMKGQGSIDYSFVSGESTPVTKEYKDHIYAGGRQIGGVIELLVEKPVDQSYLTELWNQDLNEKDEYHSLTSIVNQVSHYFTVIIISIAMLTGAWWLYKDPSVAMNVFTSVLIVACPCALALTLPFALGTAMRLLGKKGFYLKKTEVVEQLKKVDTIVFDKTGTITQNDAVDIDGAAVSLLPGEEALVRSLVRQSAHPLSISLYHFLAGTGTTGVEDFSEETGKGIKGIVEGHRVMAGSALFVTGKGPEKPVETTKVHISIDGAYRGYFVFHNRYRPGMKEVISKLSGKYELHLLSGDNEAELPRLQPLFGDPARISFRQSPSDKLQYIRELKSAGRNVLMVGDGLNDAGALKESQVGITIADNVYHFSPACDAILDAGEFRHLPRFIRFSTTSMRIVAASFAISFLYNVAGISLAASGFLTPLISAILMPLSSVSVVAFATLTTTLSARLKGISVS